MPQSLFSLFKRNRDERPDAAAFLIAAGDRSVPITWREFARDIEVIAWIVQKFAPRATVGLLGENSYEWITAHAAGLFAGVTVVPIEPALSPDDIAERLAFTGAKVLVHSALHIEKAHAVGELLPGLIVAGFGSHKADEYMSFARTALDMGEPGIFGQPPRDQGEIATIVFTSGTTSRPRGAQLTLEALATFVEFASGKLPMREGNRSLMLLPLHHIYGIAVTYLMLARGVALGVCPDFRRVYDAVARFRADYLCLVPALAEILAQKVSRHGNSAEQVFGKQLDWVLSGGAPLSRRIHDNLTSLGVKVLQIYGLTETCALYAMSPWDDPRPGSVGRSCHGFGGMETKVTVAGTLAVRGPAVLRGYYKDPEHTAAQMDDDGWFDTGDYGRIDADGYVWLTGRASRTIVLSSGKKVAPEELEDRITSIPGIREALVSGDGESRELCAEIYAVVSGETVRRQVDLLNRSLPTFQRIRRVVVREEPFPRTASGKIRLSAAHDSDSPVEGVQVIRRHGPHLRTRRFSLFFLQVAVAVLVLNLLPSMLAHSGIQLPSVIAKLVSFIGECSEILLAVVVIAAYIVSTKIFPSGSGEE